jgi:hypothetical protein
MTTMSHWTSGLPKLDIQPFDPTPLWDAAVDNQAERQVVVDRRRRMMPFVGAGLLAVMAATVGLVLFLLG